MKRVFEPAGVRAEIRSLERRGLIKRGLSLGALSLLTGCDLSTHSGVDAALWAMLKLDDRIQALLFDRRRLATTYTQADITHPFRFNAFYEDWQVRPVPDGWQLAVGGRVDDKTPWTLETLRALPQEGQITRHVCIEGWSQVGHWSGVPLATFLRRIGADLRAPYVAFKCFDGYSTSIDMASALQPQTIIALDFLGKPLTPEWGAPVRLRIPVKLGFKSAKNLEAIEVTDALEGKGGYWENQGYNWFSGT
ncbi:MAG: molybdopterin-dependent oxidoreductase [Acetobacteraceae bacterium]|nr:molybdopterin-dependent oxidoreductase [Acetobacteraceae bacterium]